MIASWFESLSFKWLMRNRRKKKVNLLRRLENGTSKMMLTDTAPR